ncbi:AraC family transcriptional regulator [Escherichia coli]|uniref:AraC family transcriptional regulator n=1 Tax=Escherichia coli TaxID=562 RepID=A0A2X1N2D2_ECOLX|nr:AraC family transcriptional regulator [Escherichia coli]
MIRQKILQQLLEWIECNLEHPISIEDIAQKSGYSRRNIQLLFRNFMHVPLENTFANEGFVVPPFLSGSPRNLCLILHSLCILIHSSHSAANLKSYSAALPVNTATVIIGISQISSLLFNTSTAKDGV